MRGVIFKREKEIARKLEGQGAWLIDQPSENNSWILSYLSREWHKLVISSKSFPDCYWDKFVKKKVRNKYSDQFDYDELSRFLGMEKNDTPGKFEIVKPVETGLWGKCVSLSPHRWIFAFRPSTSRIKSVDMRYQVWKWGVIFTDNVRLCCFVDLSFTFVFVAVVPLRFLLLSLLRDRQLLFLRLRHPPSRCGDQCQSVEYDLEIDHAQWSTGTRAMGVNTGNEFILRSALVGLDHHADGCRRLSLHSHRLQLLSQILHQRRR